MGYELPKAAQRKILGLVPGAKALEVEEGIDHAGDDAVWVWVVLDDNATDSSFTGTVQEAVRSTVRSTFDPDGKNPLIYVRYRRDKEGN